MAIWKEAYPIGRYHAGNLTWNDRGNSQRIVYFLCPVSALLVRIVFLLLVHALHLLMLFVGT
jgi:hypothetical protein